MQPGQLGAAEGPSPSSPQATPAEGEESAVGLETVLRIVPKQVWVAAAEGVGPPHTWEALLQLLRQVSSGVRQVVDDHVSAFEVLSTEDALRAFHTPQQQQQQQQQQHGARSVGRVRGVAQARQRHARWPAGRWAGSLYNTPEVQVSARRAP